MNKVENELDALITIGRWAKSCETLEQLKKVKDFFYKKLRILEKEHFSWSEVSKLNYRIGITEGIIMTTEHLKFI